MTDPAQRLLADLVGGPVDVLGAVSLGGDFAPVERWTLAADHPVIGSSVVIKSRRRDGSGWGFDPARLRREYAAAQTLEGSSLAARPLSGDDAAGVVILSDLGDGPTVLDLFLGGEREPATRALREMARSLGIMHVALAGAEPAFDSHYRIFAGGASPAAEPVPALDEPLAEWDRVRADIEEIGFPSSRAVAGELCVWRNSLRNTRFRTFTHTDLTPQNALVIGDRVVFVDFEGAGYRHIGLDAGFLRYPFQNYALAVPEQVRASAEQAYRAELAGSPWESDAAFFDLMATGCVFTVVRLLEGISRVADACQSGESARRRRVRLYESVCAAVDALDQAGSYPALTSWLGQLAAAMYARWSEIRAPRLAFPAFG